MEDELVLPIFPLPGVVLFPRTMLPLHIFEPRYRQMVADLLDQPEDQRLIIISNLDNQDLPRGENPFATISTVGRLVHVEYLEDGRSNIIIQGQFTVKVEEIRPSPQPYRVARVVEMREEFWEDPLGNHSNQQQELMSSIEDLIGRTNTQIKNLDDVKLEDLINGLSFSLNIDGDDKQELLERQKLDDRLTMLVEIIDQIGYFSEYVPDEDEYTGFN